MRHLEVRDLWLQQEVAKGAEEVVKVRGEGNPATADERRKAWRMKRSTAQRQDQGAQEVGGAQQAIRGSNVLDAGTGGAPNQ